MMSRLALLVIIGIEFFFIRYSGAQTSPSLSASEIENELQKLPVLGSILYVAAHPDDENTRLLAYLSKEKHYRTGYLSITRGDGGQNLIGNEQSELLGLIRTQELLAARRIDGAEQFFTRANDFGYSKSPEETFAFWGKEVILSDVVWVIRNFQPDVIICRFPATGEGGHGHHTASAIFAQEAFTAAADPEKFPEQLQYVQAWQAKRLLWNVFSSGNNTAAADQIKIDVGLYNPLLGKGYREIAAESRTMHKSQAFGTERQRGSHFEYFKPILGEAPKNDLMEGINISWSRIPKAESIAASVSNILSEYTPKNPASSLPSLLELYRSLKNLPENYWRNQKLKEVEMLIVTCTGLWLEAYANEPQYAAGEKIDWRFQLINRSDVPVELTSVAMQQFDTTFNFTLINNQLMNYKHQQTLNSSTPVTQPYWLLQNYTIGAFSITDQKLVGEPWDKPAVNAIFKLRIAGVDFEFSRPLVYKFEDPVKGEIYHPLSIAPPVMATITEPVFVFSNSASKEIKVNLKSAINEANGTVKIELPKGWVCNPCKYPVQLPKKGGETTVIFSVMPPPSGELNSSVSKVKAIIELNGENYDRGVRSIQYDHIPPITIFPPAESRLVTIPLKISGPDIGYLKGAGDLIPEMLQQVGFNVTMLSDEEIEHDNLLMYDAIITGVRAYNTNQRLKFFNAKLLDYVKNGGTMLIQYNTNYDLVTDQIGPHPFKISRGRVTDEKSAVRFLLPDHPVLNSPNKITLNDFEGWIQERGLYFLSDVDSSYKKILSLNDPGETALDGALIVADYGKGRFVYTGLSFFRELPAGVPGAYRLFVNLISGK